MKRYFKNILKGMRKPFEILIAPFFLILGVLFVFIVNPRRHRKNFTPRLVWGSTPIINYSYWARAMRERGFVSETFTTGYYAAINKREDWDIILQERYSGLPNYLKQYFAFFESLLRYDVFFISFDGFFLGNTLLWKLEAWLLRVAGKKTVIVPYGGDAYVYRRIKSTPLIHGLMMSYPEAAKNQKKIEKRVDYWCQYADMVITGIMGPDGFGRWDVLVPSPLCLDLSIWQPTTRSSHADGKKETVYIAHAPNHRGFKGTEFVINAVNILKDEGLKVELALLEKRQNTEVREILGTKVDVLVEQLIASGHGFNALEGMASGLPVLCNLEDESYVSPMRRWSYFAECPLVSATPETLVDVLRKLATRPELRHQLGAAGRKYMEKYHGYDSAQYLFGHVLKYVYGEVESVINLYHPLLGEYPNRLPKVEHPLVNNRIAD